ncbi:MFS transporter [Terricaulis sp.]|uniref:MFS transporter n=1 Tax=Terricaulis sp. TaxID=2768686 RepID=UPI002AC5FF79|nr:MFS transporter [Terricaulis sp.]MDZ4691719.1 MFS transporter [Terricaulis sp.]
MSDKFPDMPLWRIAIYGLPALPAAFLYVPLTTLLPAFYAQELGVSLAAVGGFMFVSRIFDIVIDPALGRWSDQTRSKWGRRKPFMVLATPITMLGAWLVFMPPEGATGFHLLLATAVIYFGASMMGLAYSAWGAEIVEHYHGRSKVAGVREIANVLGIVIAASIPAITGLFGHNGVDRFTMSIMGAVMMVITPITVLAAIKWVPERPAPIQPPMSWWNAMTSLMSNKPFRLLCIVFFVINFGASITNTTLVFYVSHYLGQPEVIGPVLLASFLFVMLGVPFWVFVSRHIGKHRAAGISLFIAISLNAVLAMQIAPGQGWLFVALMCLLGITSSAFLTLPIGIVGDIIDYDTLKTGQSRGGLFFGIWALFQYMSPALAIGLTLPALEYFGFSATGGNSPAALQALKYTFILAPLPFFLGGALMFFLFPIDARRHGIIRRRIDQRRRRDGAAAQAFATGPSLPRAAPTAEGT